MQSVQVICNECKNKYWISTGSDSDSFKTDGCWKCRCEVCSNSFKYGNNHFTGCMLRNDMFSIVCPDNKPITVKEPNDKYKGKSDHESSNWKPR